MALRKRSGTTVALMLALSAPLAVGCDRVLGLDRVDEAPPADAAGSGGPDADPSMTRLTFTHHLARYRTALEFSVIDAASQVAATSWLVPDEAEPTGLRVVPATVGPGNTLEALVPVGTPTPTLAYVTAAGVPAYLTLDAAEVQVLDGVWGDAAAGDADPTASVQLDLTVTPVFEMKESMRYDVIGPYLHRGFATAQSGTNTFTPAPLVAADLTAPPGAPRPLFTDDDLVVIGRYTLDGAVTSLTQMLTKRGDQMLPTTTITGSPSAIAIDHELTLSDVGLGAARIDGALPLFDATSTETWDIVASPATLYEARGIQLAAGSEVPAAGTSIRFGNPFTPVVTGGQAWPAVLSHDVQKTRLVDFSLELPNALTLAAGLTTTVTPPANGATIQITSPQALPATVVLAGTLLAADGQLVALAPEQAVTITVQFPEPAVGTCELYGATLVEFSKLDGKVVRTPQAIMRGTSPTFLLPRTHFQPDRLYAVRAECFVGRWPNVAAGDLVTHGLPHHYAYRDAPTFHLAAE